MTDITWNIGVLILPAHQLLDWVAPVDYISNHSRQFLSLYTTSSLVPQRLADKAPIINFHYISHNLSPVPASSGPPIHPTVTTADCPPLNYLVVPGVDPFVALPDEITQFIKKVAADPNFKAFLTVCTGSMAIASTGVLDGHSVCSNKVLLRIAAEKGILYKNVKWLGDRRWHQDGKVWSGAGITAGIDMAHAFLAAHLDRDLLELCETISEYTPRPAQPDLFVHILAGVNLES
ncbi:ThiJ/PfpI [Panaeolus papilionaceus]|nr:ThiJ/PfpI [Panaeolus papilionaceus]